MLVCGVAGLTTGLVRPPALLRGERAGVEGVHLREARVEPHGGRGDHRVLVDQGAAHAPPPDAGLGDEVLVARQHRPGDPAQALVGGDVDRGEAGGDLGVRPVVEGPAFPERAPSMCSGIARWRQASFSASSSSHVGSCPPASRIGSSTIRQPSGALRGQVGGGHRAQAIADDSPVQAENRLVGLVLVHDQVRGRMQAEAIQPRPLGPDPHRGQLRHHAAGHEGGRRLADQPRDAALEVLDQRPLAIAVARRVAAAHQSDSIWNSSARETERKPPTKVVQRSRSFRRSSAERVKRGSAEEMTARQRPSPATLATAPPGAHHPAGVVCPNGPLQGLARFPAWLCANRLRGRSCRRTLGHAPPPSWPGDTVGPRGQRRAVPLGSFANPCAPFASLAAPAPRAITPLDLTPGKGGPASSRGPF